MIAIRVLQEKEPEKKYLHPHVYKAKHVENKIKKKTSGGELVRRGSGSAAVKQLYVLSLSSTWPANKKYETKK